MYYFIVNPASSCGMGYHMWKKLEKWIEKHGIEYTAYLTEKVGDARIYATHLSQNGEPEHLIVIVGGDGTMNEVLDGLEMKSTVTLGYIPIGMSNDLARSLKLPRNPKRCLKKILTPGYYCLLDYGILSFGKEDIKHRRFMISAGIGLDAAVCHNVHHSSLRKGLQFLRLEKMIYLLVGYRQLFFTRPVKGYLLLDGIKKMEFNHICFISTQIHPCEGRGFRFVSEKKEMDGKLSISVVNSAVKRGLLSMLFQAYGKKQKKLKGVRQFVCNEVIIHTERPMAVHVDGESCLTQTDLQIRCVEGKIKMII